LESLKNIIGKQSIAKNEENLKENMEKFLKISLKVTAVKRSPPPSRMQMHRTVYTMYTPMYMMIKMNSHTMALRKKPR
jgi:hypothetical protein